MSIQSTNTLDAGRSLVGEIFRWAFPRLAVYLIAAVGSVIAFTIWAVVYTYVWPGSPANPHIPPARVTAPSGPMRETAPQHPEEGALVARVDPGMYGSLMDIPPKSITIKDWYKQSVYDPSDNKIGEITDVLVATDGRPTVLIVGVGGFLGAGQKDVAVPFMAVKQTVKDKKVYLVIDTSKDALKAAPGFKYDADKTTWVPDVK